MVRAAGEANYNPYYTLIAKKLCGGHALKMTFTFTLWDYFRRFGEDDGSGASASRGNDDDDDDDSDDDDEGLGVDHSWKKPAGLRKIVNLARMYAALVAAGSLNIAIFKTLNWSYLQGPTKSFLEVFFTAVFTETKGDAWEVASIFGKFADNIELVRGVHYFVRRRVLKTGGVAANDAEKKMVKNGAKAAVETLEAVLKADTVGGIN